MFDIRMSNVFVCSLKGVYKGERKRLHQIVDPVSVCYAGMTECNYSHTHTHTHVYVYKFKNVDDVNI